MQGVEKRIDARTARARAKDKRPGNPVCLNSRLDSLTNQFRDLPGTKGVEGACDGLSY
jgi:hypothetical protein